MEPHLTMKLWQLNKYYSLVVHAHDQTVTTDGNSASATLTVSLVDINELHATANLPATISIDAKATGANTQVSTL